MLVLLLLPPPLLSVLRLAACSLPPPLLPRLLFPPFSRLCCSCYCALCRRRHLSRRCCGRRCRGVLALINREREARARGRETRQAAREVSAYPPRR